MKFEMVLGILGHKVVLDDLRLESLCLRYLLLPLLGTHNYEQYDLSGYSYNIEVVRSSPIISSSTTSTPSRLPPASLTMIPLALVTTTIA